MNGETVGRCVPETARRALEPVVQEAAITYALPPALLWSLIEVESGYEAHFVGTNGRHGLLGERPDASIHSGPPLADSAGAQVLRGARRLHDIAKRYRTALLPTLQNWVTGSSYRPVAPDEAEKVRKILAAYVALQHCEPDQRGPIEPEASEMTPFRRLRHAMFTLGVFEEPGNLRRLRDPATLQSGLRELRSIPESSAEHEYASELAQAVEQQLEELHRARSAAAERATRQPPTAPSEESGSLPPNGDGCTPGYSPCIPPGDDVDCAGGRGNGPRYIQGPVRVFGTDQYDLDRDGDGIGCE